MKAINTIIIGVICITFANAQWIDGGGLLSTSDNVGIGVNGPRAQEQLHVFGDIAITGTNFSEISFRDEDQDPSITKLGRIYYDHSSSTPSSVGTFWMKSEAGLNVISGTTSDDVLSLFGGGEVSFILNNPSNTNDNKFTFVNGFTELAQITGSGNFGINEKNPATKLHITHTSGRIARFESTNSSDGWLEFYNNNGYAGYVGMYNGEKDMDFGTGATNTTGKAHIVTKALPRISVDQDGHVGIGTSGATSAAFQLQVKGDTDIMGELTILSDKRYKKDINVISDAVEKVLQLNPVNYNYRSNSFPDMNFSSRNQMGFLAQEVETVLPNLVSQGTEATTIEGESFNSKSVNYIELIPLLTKAIQEQQEEIKLLKEEIIKIISQN